MAAGNYRAYLLNDVDAPYTVTAFSEEFTIVHPSLGWRLWTTSAKLDRTDNGGNYWDVRELGFFASSDCIGDMIANTGTAIDSAHYPDDMFKPDKAFDGDITTFWGGRPFTDGNFWIGMEFGTGTEVGCIKLHNYVWNGAHEVTVQALRGGIWTDILTVGVSEAADVINIISITGGS